MALSRFTVLPDQAVIPQYQKKNFDYLLAGGRMRQQLYDESEALGIGIEDKYAAFQTRQEDVERKNQVVQSIHDGAQKMVQERFDGDFGQAMPALKEYYRKASTNEFFGRASQALEQEKQDNEIRKRIAEKGGSVFTLDSGRGKAIWTGEGYQEVRYDSQQQLNYTEPKMKLMADIAKDTRLQGIAPSRIAGLLQSGKFTGVTGQKVQAVAMQMLMPYLSTDEGRQEKLLLERNGYSPKQVVTKMMMDLASVGSKQIGGEADVDYTKMPGYEFMLRQQAKESEDANASLDGPEGLTGMTVNPLQGQPIAMDNEGRPYVKGTYKETKYVGKSDNPIQVDAEYKDYKGAKPLIQNLRGNYRRIYPGESAPSDKDLVARYNKAVENTGLVAMRTVSMAPRRADVASKMVLGLNYKKGDISGLQGKQIMLLGTDGETGSKKVTLPELQGLLGLDGKDVKITSAQVTGRIPYNPSIPGAYRVTVTAGGKSYELAVSGSQQEQEFQGQYQPLVQSLYTGQSGTAKIGDVEFKSIAAPTKDGKFAVQIRGYEKVDGKLVPLRERNPDGSVKVKNGKTVYAPKKSLDQFTDEMQNLFQAAYGTQYNISDYTNKDAEEEPVYED